MICFWFGAVDDIPDGFALCDGTSSTPDLRDKFILGGGGAEPTSGGSLTTASNGAHDHGGATGGHALTEGELPAFSPRLFVWESGTAGPGQMEHFAAGGIGPARGIGGNADSNSYAYREATTFGDALVEPFGDDEEHSHTIASAGAHTHTYMPPYRALFAIMKT
jgi:hypothetical protein